MLGLQRLDAWEQAFSPLDHPQRPLPRHASSSSLSFSASVIRRRAV
jgi:hypothetical protein